MMSKKPSAGCSDLKILLVIPVVAFFLFAISACEKNMSLSSSDTETLLPESSAGQPIEIDKSVYNAPLIKMEVLPPPPPLPQPIDRSIQKADADNGPFEKPAEIIVQEQVPSEIFVVVEQMPHFPGGDSELMKYINSSIVYPESAKSSAIQGRVILRFAVLYTGKIGNISVLKSVDPSLDNEARRVIESLPDWTPGKQGGKPVNVWYSIPVSFQIK